MGLLPLMDACSDRVSLVMSLRTAMLLRVVPNMQRIVHSKIDNFILLGNLSDGCPKRITIFTTMDNCFLDKIRYGQLLSWNKGQRLVFHLVVLLISSSLVYDVIQLMSLCKLQLLFYLGTDCFGCLHEIFRRYLLSSNID